MVEGARQAVATVARFSSTNVCQICGFSGYGPVTCRRLLVSASFASSSTGVPSQNHWMVDSNASHILTSDLSYLSIHSGYDDTDDVHIADGSGLPITHSGTFYLNFAERKFSLFDVLCVSGAKRNLLSVSKFTAANNVSMEFFSIYFIVKDRTTGCPLLKVRAMMVFITYPHLAARLQKIKKKPFFLLIMEVSFRHYENIL